MSVTELLRESDTFGGLTFSGCYTMPLDHFEKILNHYKETGENLLDDYSFVIHKSWENIEDEFLMMDRDHFDVAMQRISRVRGLRIKDFLIPQKALSICRKQFRRYLEWEERNSTKVVRRAEANRYTSNQDIRDAVFFMYGEKCLCCGSTENIQLDHIIPIHKDGENKIDNLQPLCKSCNVSKGTKIVDYRS